MEVTTAISQKDQKMFSLSDRLINNNLNKPNGAIKKIQKLRVTLSKINRDNNSITQISKDEEFNNSKDNTVSVSMHVRWVTLENIYKSLDKKLEKLNKPKL